MEIKPTDEDINSYISGLLNLDICKTEPKENVQLFNTYNDT